MAESSRALFLGQRGPQFLVQKGRVRAGVELVKINLLHPQRPQGGLQLLTRLGRGKSVRPVHESVKAVAELGGHDPARTVPARQIISHQALGQVVAVTFRSVNQIYPQFGRLVQDRVRLRLRKNTSPFSAKLPGAQADDRHAQTSPAKISIMHEVNLPKRMTGRPNYFSMSNKNPHLSMNPHPNPLPEGEGTAVRSHGLWGWPSGISSGGFFGVLADDSPSPRRRGQG